MSNVNQAPGGRDENVSLTSTMKKSVVDIDQTEVFKVNVSKYL